jgi:hypothetical protein
MHQFQHFSNYIVPRSRKTQENSTFKSIIDIRLHKSKVKSCFYPIKNVSRKKYNITLEKHVVSHFWGDQELSFLSDQIEWSLKIGLINKKMHSSNHLLVFTYFFLKKKAL